MDNKNRFYFRAVLKTDKFTILVEPFYILNSCYFIDINKAEAEFKCKYPDECFWDFIEEIEKQDYIQEISIDGDLIITNDFTNLMQCTGLKDNNGKLIYEGDIVKDLIIPEISYIVKWSNGGFYFVSTLSGSFLKFNDTQQKVIGNIYENSELLNEEKNDDT